MIRIKPTDREVLDAIRPFIDLDNEKSKVLIALFGRENVEWLIDVYDRLAHWQVGDLSKVKIAHLEQISDACPTQWEGKTTNGENIYIRYRFGNLTVEINNVCVFKKMVGDNFYGMIEWEEVARHTGLEWSGND